MQYKVPQNVDMPDRVIAGLTLRQFMFLMVAGGIILACNYLLVGSLRFLFLPLAVLIGGAGAALAFFKINDRPFEIFLTSIAKTFVSPRSRVWLKEAEQEKAVQVVKKTETATKRKRPLSEERNNLKTLASIVDSGGTFDDPERISNLQKRQAEDENLKDIIAETEKPSEKIGKILNDATNFVVGQKKEPPVSSVASIHSKKGDYPYEQMDLKSEAEAEAMVMAANEKEEAFLEKMEQAKINKNPDA